MKRKTALPELLAPAGSPLALDAAIAGGADAVFFGGSAFNARLNAANILDESIPEIITKCHAYGVKAYVTLNTLTLDKEIRDVLKFAEMLYKANVDALIVADTGLSRVLKQYIPELELHASTQLSGHNSYAAKVLEAAGFSRMVCAREMSASDIDSFIENSPIEAEVFVHGALCVSHSGQCLFSSMCGGRSGNRGECAQPCRLNYESSAKSMKYPLSLKDLSLAPHIQRLISSGVASLKIEGRMKSPDYVYNVVSVYRKLLDERRGATADELQYLAEVFSRGGSFTQGYYENKIGTDMLGVRGSEDKLNTRDVQEFKELTKKNPIKMKATFKAGEPCELEVTKGEKVVTAYGDVVEKARTAPMSAEDLKKNLSKLGATYYEVAPEDITVTADKNIMVPVSKLNLLRRNAIAMLDEIPYSVANFVAEEYSPNIVKYSNSMIAPTKTARFLRPENITPLAREYFEKIFLPLEKFDSKTGANGVIIPAVVFDREYESVRFLIEMAISKGAKYALIGNLGHKDLLKDLNIEMLGDFRLNILNSESLAFMYDQGFSDVIISPEATLPQIRDLRDKSKASVITYGRVPVMLLEKCLTSDLQGCSDCLEDKEISLTDRRGTEFPLYREFGHRNVVYNSVPVYMADKKDQLEACGAVREHFIFSTETHGEVDMVISSYKKGLSTDLNIRRIN